MTWSLFLHTLLLAGLLWLFSENEEYTPAPEENRLVVRPLAVAPRPEPPELKAGNETAAPEPLPPQPAPVEEKPVSPTSPLPPPAGHEAPRAKSKPPEFLLPEADYPTHQPISVAGASGQDPINLKGESESADRPALPYYHPSVTLEGRTGRDWILVRFEVAANGTFKVEMLDGTGDIHQDARVLNVLRRWKWLPMRIDGQTYPSVEVIRLYRHEV